MSHDGPLGSEVETLLSRTCHLWTSLTCQIGKHSCPFDQPPTLSVWQAYTTLEHFMSTMCAMAQNNSYDRIGKLYDKHFDKLIRLMKQARLIDSSDCD